MLWLCGVGWGGGGGGRGRVAFREGGLISKSVEMEGSFFKFMSRPNVELFMRRTKVEFEST